MQAGANQADTPDSPSAGVDLTVVIPTRNEAGNISPLLNRLAGALGDVSFEALFVDDSSDATPQIIVAEAANRPFPIRVIARPPDRRNGLSGAVVEGMEAANGRWLCVIDADLQHPPEIIPRLLDQASRTGADLVVASRQADLLGPIGLSRGRALTSQTLTILARMVFPRVLKNVSDPLTGFFLAQRAAINTALLQPEGFKILLEILARHPDLRVTELHFNFAQRREGQSKADLNEGMRFFRHLTRLRLTVNQHLIRFIIVVLLAVAINLTLLLGLTAVADWPVMPAALLAGSITIGCVLLGEAWVFNDRPRGPKRRRLAAVLFVGVLFLFAIYLPVVWLLAVRLASPTLIAGLAAMLLAGFAYYAVSEQWIWTRGLMMRPRASVYYNIHDILYIGSQVPLNDLAYFATTETPEQVDLQVRVDRHGTPSRVPGAICYDEQLGRFGFGLTVLPGDITEIIVSPLLETSPAFLYTNVVEPVLRWFLVTRGFVMARAGGVSDTAGNALLITAQPGLGYGLARLCAERDLAFLGDDRVIIHSELGAYSFPKPVTARPDILPSNIRSSRAALALRLRRLLYSGSVRRLGIFLSRLNLPAATANTYIQRVIPQPKYPIDVLAPGVAYSRNATPGFLIVPETSTDRSLLDVEDDLLVLHDDPIGFQPYPLLIDQLARWGGQDWVAKERAILRAGLSECRRIPLILGERWWEQVDEIIGSHSFPNQLEPTPPLSLKPA